MVTMVDEIYDRHYQAGRHQLNASITAGLARAASAFRNTFEVLVKIEYQAPWTVKSTRSHCN